MFHFMRLGLTTEGAETPVRAARKEACERIRFAQLGRNSPTLDGRQMICGRGVDEWHEVRLPPSSFRAPRSGFPRFQWLTDLSTAPRIKCAPSPDRGIDNSALSAQMDLTLFVYTLEVLYGNDRCPLIVDITVDDDGTGIRPSLPRPGLPGASDDGHAVPGDIPLRHRHLPERPDANSHAPLDAAHPASDRLRA